jgi:hypothetical protein
MSNVGFAHFVGALALVGALVLMFAISGPMAAA